jgi:hypothetical protein
LAAVKGVEIVNLNLKPGVVSDEHTPGGCGDTSFTNFVEMKVAAMKTEMRGRTKEDRQGIY